MKSAEEEPSAKQHKSVDYSVHLAKIILMTQDVKSIALVKILKLRFRCALNQNKTSCNSLLGNFYNTYCLFYDRFS